MASDHDRPTREYKVVPEAAHAKSVHTAPTREFPAYVDPSEVFESVDRHERETTPSAEVSIPGGKPLPAPSPLAMEKAGIKRGPGG